MTTALNTLANTTPFTFRDVLKKNYDITEDWKGAKFAGMDLEWDYSKHTCCVSMPGYIEKFLARYGHRRPSKPQLSPHQHSPISYGAKTQKPADPNSLYPLDADGIKRVQGTIGALLWYGNAVNNKILVALSAMGYQQGAATNYATDAIHQPLDYVATYPNKGITYRAIDMVL